MIPIKRYFSCPQNDKRSVVVFLLLPSNIVRLSEGDRDRVTFRSSLKAVNVVVHRADACVYSVDTRDVQSTVQVDENMTGDKTKVANSETEEVPTLVVSIPIFLFCLKVSKYLSLYI